MGQALGQNVLQKVTRNSWKYLFLHLINKILVVEIWESVILISSPFTCDHFKQGSASMTWITWDTQSVSLLAFMFYVSPSSIIHIQIKPTPLGFELKPFLHCASWDPIWTLQLNTDCCSFLQTCSLYSLSEDIVDVK